MSLSEVHRMKNSKDIPTLVDCDCKAIVWNDESGVEIEYCHLHRSAQKLFDSGNDLVDLLSMLGHWDASYCESCKSHAPKNERGELTGDIVHKDDCIIGGALVLLARIRGGENAR